MIYDPKTVGMDIMTDKQSVIAFFSTVPGLLGLLADYITTLKCFDKGCTEGGLLAKKLMGLIAKLPMFKTAKQGDLLAVATFVLCAAMYLVFGMTVANIGGWWPCLIGPAIGIPHLLQAKKNMALYNSLPAAKPADGPAPRPPAK